MKNKTAFCFDLDGTLTYEEILPVLAKEIDLFDEMKLLTNITMNGLMTFHQSFKLRVKLLSNIRISRANEIIQNVSIQKKLSNFIKNNSDRCFVITGNLDVWVDKFIKDNFGCKYFSSKASVENDRITKIESVLYKGNVVEQIRDNFDNIVAIGDGMNDGPMFEKSDISIAYGSFRQPNESLIKLANYVIFNEDSLCNMLNML